MAKPSKKKGISSHDAFVRQTIQSNILEDVVEIPNNLKNRLVEMILLPLDGEKYGQTDEERTASTLKRFAGAWAGEPLVREDQGDYETREELP